jgi:hypothetical protein
MDDGLHLKNLTCPAVCGMMATADGEELERLRRTLKSRPPSHRQN